MTIASNKFKLHHFCCLQPKWSVLLVCTIHAVSFFLFWFWSAGCFGLPGLLWFTCQRIIYCFHVFRFTAQRLATANDDIVDVLLSKNQVYARARVCVCVRACVRVCVSVCVCVCVRVCLSLNLSGPSLCLFLQLIPALRFLRSMGREDMVSARQFLEAASNSGDNMLFYSGQWSRNNMIVFSLSLFLLFSRAHTHTRARAHACTHSQPITLRKSVIEPLNSGLSTSHVAPGNEIRQNVPRTLRARINEWKKEELAV